jgi:hypothetical protein
MRHIHLGEDADPSHVAVSTNGAGDIIAQIGDADGIQSRVKLTLAQAEEFAEEIATAIARARLEVVALKPVTLTPPPRLGTWRQFRISVGVFLLVLIIVADRLWIEAAPLTRLDVLILSAAATWMTLMACLAARQDRAPTL